jgi:hypothetical protein
VKPIAKAIVLRLILEHPKSCQELIQLMVFQTVFRLKGVRVCRPERLPGSSAVRGKAV